MPNQYLPDNYVYQPRQPLNYNGYQIAPQGITSPEVQKLIKEKMLMTDSFGPSPVLTADGQMVGVQGSGDVDLSAINPITRGQEMVGFQEGGGVTPSTSPEITPSLPPEIPQGPSDFEIAGSNLLGGALDATRARAEGAAQKSSVLGALPGLTNQTQQNIQLARQQYEESARALEKERNSLREEIKNSKIENPWDQKSGTQKLFAAIAVGLGGFGAAATGSQNYALDIINKDIQRNIDLQKEAINKKKGDLADVNNELSLARQKYGDEKLAELEVNTLQRQAIDDQLRVIESQTENKEALANIQFLRGQNAMQLDQLKDESLKRKQELLKGGIEIQTALGKGAEPEKEVLERFVPGVGVALDKESAKTLREEGAAVYESIPLVDNLLSLNEQTFRSLNPTERAKINQQVALLTGKLRIPVVGPGAFTDKEREFIANEIVGNPAAIFAFDSTNKAKLEQLKSILKRSREEKIAAYGARPFSASEQAYNDRLLGRPASASSANNSGSQKEQIQQLKQQYIQRLQANPNDSQAKQRLQAIEAKGF